MVMTHTRAKKLKAKVSLLVRTVENKVETETDGKGAWLSGDCADSDAVAGFHPTKE